MNVFRLGYTRTFVEIGEDWRVLDVGSGHNPHPRADVLVERNLLDDTQRSHVPARLDRRCLVVADGEALPFRDRSFDYVIASHVAEHVEHPDVFVDELVRVAARGYIETPSRLAEQLLGEPFHIWYVSGQGNRLRFQRISDAQNMQRPRLSHLFYGLYYFNTPRAQPTIMSDHIVFRPLLKGLSWVLHKLFVHTRLGYTSLLWENDLRAEVFRS